MPTWNGMECFIHNVIVGVEKQTSIFYLTKSMEHEM